MDSARRVLNSALDTYREIRDKTFKTYVPKDSLITRLESLSQPVLDAIDQIDAIEDLDRDELLKTTKKLFTLLHDTFGYNLFKQRLIDLSPENKRWVQENLIEYNYQLRIFYGYLLEELKTKSYSEARIILLSETLTQHTQNLKILFDSLTPLVQNVIVLEEKPLYDNSAVFYDNSTPYYGHRYWNHEEFGNFWYCQGFNTGYNHPYRHHDNFILFCNSGYRQGRGSHAVVHLMSQVLPKMAKGILEVDRELLHLSGEALKSAGGLLEKVPEVLVHGAEALGHLGHVAVDGMVSVGKEIGNCCTACANSNCMGGCLDGAKNLCCDGVNCIGEGCSVCSSISDGIKSCGEDAEKAIKGAFTVVGGLVIGAINLVEGNKGNNSSSPPPSLFSSSSSSSTGIHNFTSSLSSSLSSNVSSSSTGIGRRLLDISDNQIQITGSLAPAKWVVFGVIAATLGVEEGLASVRAVRNIFSNYKTTESISKLASQWGWGGVGFGVFYAMPGIGGPHMAMLVALGAGFGGRYIRKSYFNEKNKQTYQQTNPDKYLMTKEGLFALRNKMAEDKKEYSALQVQRGLAWLEAEIKIEKEKARAAGCPNSMLRLIGTYQESNRQTCLKSALKGLRKGNYSLFETNAQRAGLQDPWSLLVPQPLPLPANNRNVQPETMPETYFSVDQLDRGAKYLR